MRCIIIFFNCLLDGLEVYVQAEGDFRNEAETRAVFDVEILPGQNGRDHDHFRSSLDAESTMMDNMNLCADQ